MPSHTAQERAKKTRKKQQLIQAKKLRKRADELLRLAGITAGAAVVARTTLQRDVLRKRAARLNKQARELLKPKSKERKKRKARRK